jgi:acetyltransferase-like isoleucine patch superfamily enzyme
MSEGTISVQQLADDILKYVLQAMIHTPTVYGDLDKLILGKSVNLMNTFFNLACGTVTIGDGTFCGHGVSILTGSHYLHEIWYRPRAAQGRDIVIGQGVWLASNCTILGPCTIGDECVVAAGAVVTPRSHLEPGWIYAGVPARKLRPAIDVRADAGIGPLLLPDLREKK